MSKFSFFSWIFLTKCDLNDVFGSDFHKLNFRFFHNGRHFGSFLRSHKISSKISFVRSSEGIVGKYYFRIVEKRQIYNNNISTALLNKTKAFLSI